MNNKTKDQNTLSTTTPKTRNLDQEESTTSEETSLEDEWAAALAEQSQADADSNSLEEQNIGSTSEDNLVPSTSGSEPTASSDKSESPEARLEDEWAAALAEQDQADSLSVQTEAARSHDNSEPLISHHSITESESTIDSSDPNDAGFDNDWTEVLKDQTKISLPKTQESSEPTPDHDISLRKVTKEGIGDQTPHGEQSLDSPIPEIPREEPLEDRDKMVMNWPEDDWSQSRQFSAPSEWKPTRLGPHSTTSQTQQTISSHTEFSGVPASQNLQDTSPNPEFPLAAVAAEASIQAAVKGASSVSDLIQKEEDITPPDASNLGLEPTVSQHTDDPMTSQEVVEPGLQEHVHESDGLPQYPEPPRPIQPSQHRDQAPDRFRRPFFTGSGGSLFGMFTMNTLLTLLTLGVYSFWGRVKIRRYLHSQTKFGGARLAFHGTGAELFQGWMKAIVIFGIPYVVLHYAGTLQIPATFQWGVNILAGLLILCFIPIAIVGSHRYRMSRTTWRGIYFSFRNSAKDFLALYLKGTILSILTLGMYLPVFDHAKRKFLVSGTYFGSRSFDFDGDTKELGTIYFKAFRLLALTFVTAEAVWIAASYLSGQDTPNQMIGMVLGSTMAIGSMVIPSVIGLWFWFQAARQRYLWSHTQLGPARFRATMTGKELFELKTTNLLLLVVSLGLAWPWVQTRNLQFLYYHIGLHGPLNLKQVVQESSTASPIGEELAGFFDTGFDLG